MLVDQQPQAEDKKEWVASNTLEFYNQVHMMYGTVVEYCTPQTCDIMNAGPKVEYYWADGNIVKKPIRLCAQEYTKIAENNVKPIVWGCFRIISLSLLLCAIICLGT